MHIQKAIVRPFGLDKIAFSKINAYHDNSLGHHDMNLPLVQIQSASRAHQKLPYTNQCPNVNLSVRIIESKELVTWGNKTQPDCLEGVKFNY